MKKEALLYLLLIHIVIFSSAQTPAHRRSSFAVIDPSYRSVSGLNKISREAGIPQWIYGFSELESWRLQELIRRKDTAGLKVGYPGVFHQPLDKASFRLILKEPVQRDSISFRVVGKGQLWVNGKMSGDFIPACSFCPVVLRLTEPVRELKFELIAGEEPPALSISESRFSTMGNGWEWKSGTGKWQPASHFSEQRTGVPPHRYENPEQILKPVSVKGNIYDFGRELFGYVWVKSKTVPRMFAGESLAETEDTVKADQEQSTAMKISGDGWWKSVSPLAFRYLKVAGAKEVSVRALFFPAVYRGAFACSDPLLTRIWMNSAYTLHMCMSDFLIDGIKRDRLPWAGDLSMSLMANAFTFADPEIVRRSLTVLGSAGIRETHINGILDYSLWWIISQNRYQLYFDDQPYLSREWQQIKAALEVLSSRCDRQGFLNTDNLWVFIDWVDQEKWTALQILWWWAQQSGIHLARKMNDWQTADILQKQSEALKEKLFRVAWDPQRRIWIGNPEYPDHISKHANFLAVISGLTDSKSYDKIKILLADEKINPVGTPYMAGFENMALARMGNVSGMVSRIENYWGGMLDRGATTFWEAYNPGDLDKKAYTFYDRPYGKSLCHAWSSGPAAILPSGILGLKILEDGWKRFSLDPHPGNLKWIDSTIPSPYGNIIVHIRGNKMTVKIPQGITLEWEGQSFPGPVNISKHLKMEKRKNHSITGY